MQGDQAFVVRGQLFENLNDRINLQKASGTDYLAYYVPTNLSQNHWVLTVMEVSTSEEQMYVYYFDPFGHSIPASLYSTLHSLAEEQHLHFKCESHGDSLQFDGYNCGPWIVKYARTLAAPDGEPYPFPPQDINQSREEHMLKLEELGVARPGNTARKKTSKRQKAKTDGGPNLTKKAKQTSHNSAVANASLFSQPESLSSQRLRRIKRKSKKETKEEKQKGKQPPCLKPGGGRTNLG